ncbi:MAG TPA: response regulator [Epsilonproteobacteria bacterium]|nr:response regulator [Campylobacterota bacterium]
MLKKYLKLIIILLPLAILLSLGSYFAYDSWVKYQNEKSLKSQLDNTELIQSLEHSVLNEIVCVATMSGHQDLINKVCTPTQKTTDAVMQQILAQKEDTSLYKLEKVVYNLRSSVANNGMVAVEKLVNGDLNKQLNVFIQKYTDKIKNHSKEMANRAYLTYYADIANISYATESEKALASYYLTLKKPIPSKNLIYWDETVKNSQILEQKGEQISILHQDIEDIFHSKDFQAILRGIEDIRIDIMTHASSGNYQTNVTKWVSLLNQKQKVLTRVERMLLGQILDDASTKMNTYFWIFIVSGFAILLSMLGLLFYLLSWRKSIEKEKLLNTLLSKMSQISSDSSKLEVKDDVSSYKLAYDYIGSSYENIHEKENVLNMENKTHKAFLNNLAYEIQTPLNGISGYTKLLKETELNTEQSDFVDIIENSFENLDSILSKIRTDSTLPAQKLEVSNASFDIVKKIESAVETFSVKADQKDILLGLYIDPSLSYKVKGDGTKLSQIITNLIDNALNSSNAYDTIDITLEKIHSDMDQVSIKFAISDKGIGYNKEETDSMNKIFDSMETVENINTLDMKNLSISSKIIKRMGGKLEVMSKKGEGSTFFFTLSFEKDNQQAETSVYPTFEGMRVGLALPSKDIHRQIDQTLEIYVKHLGASFTVYDYETLFEKEEEMILPDLMLVYHNYARLDGELESFSNLGCKVTLITSGILRSRINADKFTFSSIVYAPMTMRKIVKIFAESKLEKPIVLEEIEEKTEDTEENQKFEHIKALVADDNEISQKIIANMLKKTGVDVILANNGQKAFELRRENDFDIIFMDIDMPLMNGLEATSKILYYEGVNQFKHVPIIALTTDSDQNAKEKYMKAGMDDYLLKPIDAQIIYDVVQKYCVDLPKEMAQAEEDELIAKVLAGDFLK